MSTMLWTMTAVSSGGRIPVALIAKTNVHETFTHCTAINGGSYCSCIFFTQMSVSVNEHKKRPTRTGIIIHTTAVTLIEPADDDKITIIVDGPIGVIDNVTTEMTLGGPEGIVTKVGDNVVIKQSGGKKKKAKVGVKKTSGTINMFL